MPTLDQIRRGQRPARDLITKVSEEVKALLAKEELKDEDLDSLEECQEMLKKHRRLLDDWDAKMRAQIVEDDLTKEEEANEYEQMGTWMKLYMSTNRKIEKYRSKLLAESQESVVTASSVTSERRRRCTLPEVKIPTFSGELTEWISWWTQFKKIHHDDELPPEDKFHYLKQSLLKGSEPYLLVESYPMSATNYMAAITALEQRFGRRDLLLQVYIRELLTMAISRVNNEKKDSVSQLVMQLKSRLQALAELDFHNAEPAILIYPLVESSLTDEVLKAWQRSPEYRLDGKVLTPKKTKLDLLLDFLDKEARDEQERVIVRKNLDGSNPDKTEKKVTGGKAWKGRKVGESPTVAGLFAGSGGISCFVCKGSHTSDACPTLRKMSPEKQRETMRDKNLCFQCIRPGHRRTSCKRRVQCEKCKRFGHLEIVCAEKATKAIVPIGSKRTYEGRKDQGQQKKLRFVENSDNDDLRVVAQHSNQCSAKVLLNTIKVKIDLGFGDYRVVRLVGDSCSQRSFGREKILKEVSEEPIGEEWLQTIVFGAVKTIPRKYLKKKVRILGFNGVSKSIELLEKATITGEIREVPFGPWIDECASRGIEINDVGSEWSEADILVGNDYWGALRTGNLVQLSCGLTAEETIFGWTLGGPMPCEAVMSATCRVEEVSPYSLNHLWSLETLGIKDPIGTLSAKEEEEEAMRHFKETVKRSESGAYIVSLPWKFPKSDLPTNRKVAEARLRSATYKMKAAGKFQVYHEVFKAWEKEGLITKIAAGAEEGHFIPHRPVFKQSETTPCRPVYDASCRQGRLQSLNDCLYKGPNLIELIPALLLRFGEKEIGVTADIRKAFQMLEVNLEDKQYQRFLWWENCDCEKVVVYEHNRVVFGITSSPFLLAASILHHLSAWKKSNTARGLERSFYVDNLVTSMDNVGQYEGFRKEACDIMAEARMELRQWACARDDQVEEKEVPLLGLLWNIEDDQLSCVIKKTAIVGPITKRIMLSVVAQVFDPMGYLAPALLLPKAMVQVSWEKKCGWDEPVPVELAKQFEKWMSQLETLREVKIPRWNKVQNYSIMEIHIFCDSSSIGMAAVAFVKTSTEAENKVQFLMCKSRLTPLAKGTIPRLELVSCLLGVRLARTISEALGLPADTFTFWSDSTTALAWIRRDGSWGVFVRNRVKEILAFARVEQWRHVPGVLNPADLPSRGCAPKFLIQSKWWEGPIWLIGNSYDFREEPVREEEVRMEMMKQVVVAQHKELVYPRVSSYRKLIRVWGWVLRFVENCSKGRGSSHQGICRDLTDCEIRRAERKLLKLVQSEVFDDDCKVIAGIEVFRDKGGVIRVKSRLVNRDDLADFIYPIILPKFHPVVEMLIEDAHRFHGHGGVQFLLSKLREKYWILQGRKVIRKVIKRCIQCKRHTVQAMQVDPAPLPALRVKSGDVFETTGVDLAGPLFLRDGKKVWIVVFTCAVYRAVHLDLVASLSTEDFVLALERFISLHGRPSTMWSDNGTNFVGAVNLFKGIDWMTVERKTSAKQIRWIFNPPTAAWWGGWWERIIRSVKDLLKRMLGRAKLTYDQLRTCLAGITATINDRPLTVVTEDPLDLVPLTPSMFMRPRMYGHFPDLEKAQGLKARYRKMKALQRAVEERFRKEYLALLVARCGKGKPSKIEVGDVVLVGADNRKRYEWPLGLVVELCTGKDEKTRVARVKTSNGVLCRPLQRLYPLEISNKEERKVAAVPEEKQYLVQKTRVGRVVKPPTRYGQWCHLVVNA